MTDKPKAVQYGMNKDQMKEYDRQLENALEHFHKGIDCLKLAIEQIPNKGEGGETLYRLSVIESEVDELVSLSYPGDAEGYEQ